MDPKHSESQTVKKTLFSCAIYGAVAWTAYAVVECWFSIFLPWIIEPSYDYVQLHWGFTVLLFVIYPLIGLVLGGVCGLCYYAVARLFQSQFRTHSISFFPAIGTFSVVVAFALNIIINGSISIRIKDFSLLFVYFLLAFGLILSFKSNLWFRRLRFMMNPWTVSIVLLGLPWINKELLSGFSKTFIAWGTFVYSLVVFLISFYIQKKACNRRIFNSNRAYVTPSIKSLTFLALVVLMVLGASFFLKQRPLRKVLAIETSFSGINRPSVILIVMDTVRVDHLSLYGYKRNTSFNINKFAKEAALYTHSIASGDFTLSTHASMFTGMYARQHGAHNKHDLNWLCMPLAPKFNTLAEILSEKKYLTMGISANVGYLSHRYNMDQGFQYYDNRAPVHFFGRTDRFYLREYIRSVLAHFASAQEFEKGYRNAEDINNEVFVLLKKIKKIDRPFFLFINYMDAHTPYLPPGPYDELYPGKEKKFNSSWYAKTFGEIMTLKRKITVKEYNHLISQYDGEIAYVDFHIGKLITRLKELGLFENSLIIITSDHGETFGERNFMQHGFSVYQDQIHVPLIIKYPNINEGHIVDEPVNSVDLMPTVLDVLGYEIPEDIQGQSLVNLETIKSRFILSESFPNAYVIKWHNRFDRTERAIFLGRSKFISSTAGKKELYDLQKDPDEKENLYNAVDNKSRELKTLLNNWLKTTKAEAESSSPIKLKRDAFERLRALGYIK